jgi:hypothetical protein
MTRGGSELSRPAEDSANCRVLSVVVVVMGRDLVSALQSVAYCTVPG